LWIKKYENNWSRAKIIGRFHKRFNNWNNKQAKWPPLLLQSCTFSSNLRNVGSNPGTSKQPQAQGCHRIPQKVEMGPDLTRPDITFDPPLTWVLFDCTRMQKIEKFDIFRGNFPNPNNKWLTQSEPQKFFVTRTHHYQKVFKKIPSWGKKQLHDVVWLNATLIPLTSCPIFIFTPSWLPFILFIIYIDVNQNQLVKFSLQCNLLFCYTNSWIIHLETCWVSVHTKEGLRIIDEIDIFQKVPCIILKIQI